MFSLPSSRLFVVPAFSLLIAALFYSLIVSQASIPSRISIARRVLAQLPRGTLLSQDGADVTRYKWLIDPSCLENRDPSPPLPYYNTSDVGASPVFIHLSMLLTCQAKPNLYTNHIRLQEAIFNVSSDSPDATEPSTIKKFNPTIIALPHWSPSRYLLVSRVVTEGLHQESLLCEAQLCQPSHFYSPNAEIEECTSSVSSLLGAAGGLHCVSKPVILNIPPTPAERCTGAWKTFPDIPGFHDPRVFWSGKGEPLVMVNSASRYGCVGLWVMDLRMLYPPLAQLLKGRDIGRKEALMSYPHLTELTRNPRSDRSEVEKNWMLFFPNREEAFVHYDMVERSNATKKAIGSGRSFAKLIGNGYSTPNLADPREQSCFTDRVDGKGKIGHWHQGSNALKLLLYTRAEAKAGLCSDEEEGRSVHFAVMHRKFSNDWDLPLRYERWFVVWEGRAPFRLLAKSRFPILFHNETASGWTGQENWVVGVNDVEKEETRVQQLGAENTVNMRRWENAIRSETPSYAPHWLNISGNGAPTNDSDSESSFEDIYLQSIAHNSPPRPEHEERINWAYFTYTPSIAWAWRPKSAEIRREDRDGGGGAATAGEGSYLHTLNVGYLDDEVIVGIGLEDTAQGFARVQARTLLQCLEICPGATDER